jgi:processive 1,2-diacylglycerol beta-glucosyltransferase
MNIIILTGKFGMGHVKTAEAIKEEIIKKNGDCNVQVVDFLEYLNPTFSKVSYVVFDFMVNNCSHIYNVINRIASHFCSVPMKNFIYKKIDKLIDDTKCDLIISTFPACSQCISAYKEQKQSNITLYTYITDITIHEEWIAKNNDLYFVGSNATKNILISNGVTDNKIVVSGIPVLSNFKNELIKDNETERKEILIMGGGLGLIPRSKKMISRLSKNSNFHITIITGKNIRLKEKLTKKYPFVEVIGFTNNVAYYLRRSDIIITKSGGITTFEAINMGTPLFVLKPFINAEMGNAEFIEQNNIGKVMWSKNDDIETDIEDLLNNKKLLSSMKNNMYTIKNSFQDSCPLAYFKKEA